MKRKYNEQEVRELRELYVPVFEVAQEWDRQGTLEYQRLRHCSAEYAVFWKGGTKYVLLKSYSTDVAIYDVRYNRVVEYGHFTKTTYQHIAKFRQDMYLQYRVRDVSIPVYYTERVNLELVDWF